MRRASLFVLVLVTLASLCPAKERFNVDISIGWGGCYRPMQWTPVDVGISSNLTRAFEGTVKISAAQDELTGMTINQSFVLTQDLPKTLPLVTKFAYAVDTCRLSIFDGDGKPRWRYNYSLGDYSGAQLTLKTVKDNDLLIGIVGRRVFGLSDLPRHSICSTKDRGPGRVYLESKLPWLLPWDWTGYSSLDLLILYDPDLSSITPDRAKAISQWVSNGGRLLLVLGGNPIPPEHPLAKILPFEFGEPEQTVIPPAMLSKWNFRSDNQTPVVVWPVRSKNNSSLCEMKFYQTAKPLFATDFLGFGRVGVLSFDPSALKAIKPENAARFWVEHFSALLDNGRQEHRQIQFGTSAGDRQDGMNDYVSYEPGTSGQAINHVVDHLQKIRELRPLSIWWVILMLAGLAFLLGPIDYLVLKRLGRLPLTWITSACYIIVFTLVAYYGVLALRAGEMQLRAVSVVDAIEDSEHIWRTTYSGLFAPASDEYHLNDLRKNQWWSAVSPREEAYYGRGARMGSRHIYCTQRDGGNLPTALPISIWTMQCLICESPGQKLPIKAQVQRKGQQLVLSIENNSDRPIERGYVRLGGNLRMEFGSVPPGQSRQFQDKLTKTRDWSTVLSSRARREFDRMPSGFRPDTTYFAQGTFCRTRGIEAYLEKGAAVVCVRYTNADLSFGLAGRTWDEKHSELVRLVVFPK